MSKKTLSVVFISYLLLQKLLNLLLNHSGLLHVMLGVSHQAVIAPRVVVVAAAVLRGNVPDNQTSKTLENV